jgi:hypothetical protein
MSVLAIDYDLYKESGRVYEGLISKIKAFPWCHPTESCWYIRTSLEPKQVYEQLAPSLHRRDKVLISPVAGGVWWSQGLPADVLAWLHGSLDSKLSA